MRLTILGSGTSHGIPVVGCSCSVCRSENLINNRTRASALIETGSSVFVIDTSTDFRFQALRERLTKLDFVLFTHSHADHVHGLDDLRPLTRADSIPAFGNALTIKDLKKRFSYLFNSSHEGGGVPRIDFNVLPPGKHRIGDIEITPVPVSHGSLEIYGYRFGSLAYITDCSFIPESSWSILKGIDLLVIGALRYKKHSTHFNVDEAAAAAEKSGCRKAWITHMCHDIEHTALEKQLPSNISVSYDGLKIDFE